MSSGVYPVMASTWGDTYRSRLSSSEWPTSSTYTMAGSCSTRVRYRSSASRASASASLRAVMSSMKPWKSRGRPSACRATSTASSCTQTMCPSLWR